MKKLVIFITLFLVLAAADAFAASTAVAPYKGNTHTYSATVAGGSGFTTRWYVASNVDKTRATMGASDVFTIASTSGQPAGTWSGTDWTGTGVYSVDITWGTGAVVGTTYFVYLEVDQDGCTNSMAMEVKIATSDFNVLAFNMTGASDPKTAATNDSGIVPNGCPDDVVNPIWNQATSSHTDPGTTELAFRVVRENSVLSWDFKYSIVLTTTSSATLNNVTIKDDSDVLIDNDAASTDVISMTSGQDYAMVYVKVDNVEGADIKVDLNILVSTNETKDAGDNYDTSADLATYTIKPIPAITNFGGM